VSEHEEIIERIAGRRVVASISAGKDSAAMSLYLTELGIEHDRVHLPTGWDARVTMDYMRGELTRVIGPIIHWTEQDVIDIHRRHGLTPNPLYLQGASRVGCWPCIYARKAEIRHIAEVDPARIDELRALEAELSERAGSQRTWFQNPLGREGVMGIDDVVAWSRTLHGGRVEDRQIELFVQADEGCMRWGLCETGGDE
jgi:3'-phosphoadenosine 5'-phosphosulfate sulfotransferase (PAPS reductase)/FAD synthetase